MSADQASGLGSVVLLLVLAFVGMGLGFGFLWGAGSSNKKEGGSGMNAGKIVTLLVVGFVLVTWLAAPGTGQGIAGAINAMWGNVLVGVQPLISIAFQLTMLLVVAYIGYLFWKRRR